MSESPEKRLEEVVQEDGRYPLEAFGFLHDGLGRAVSKVHGDETEPDKPHHVTGEQLCGALREEALARWNVHSTIDFGNMVYLLVENGLMHKTDEDSVEDFRDIYDFQEAFGPGAVFNPEP